METVRAEVPPASDGPLLPYLAVLSAALADAEACVLKNDEMRAAVVAGVRRLLHGFEACCEV